MSDRRNYPLKSDSSGLEIVCGTIGCRADGYATSGVGFSSITHTAANRLVINHDNYPQLAAAIIEVQTPDTANTCRAFVIASAPTTGTTTIQEQTALGTAGDFINSWATASGTKINFALYFRNTDLPV
jgi:allophanate hydrolase subunit 2